MQASQYSDEWAYNENNFRSFYICLAGGQHPCNTVIPSKTWSTKHKDPLATKQRWYCICCGAKYLVKFGMVIEIQVDGTSSYVKADIPPDNLEDLRAMKLEQTLQPKDPDHLFAMLKLVTPQKSAILRPITQDEVLDKTKFDKNAFKIDASAYKQLPHFEWQQIMNFGKVSS